MKIDFYLTCCTKINMQKIYFAFFSITVETFSSTSTTWKFYVFMKMCFYRKKNWLSYMYVRNELGNALPEFVLNVFGKKKLKKK